MTFTGLAFAGTAVADDSTTTTAPPPPAETTTTTAPPTTTTDPTTTSSPTTTTGSATFVPVPTYMVSAVFDKPSYNSDDKVAVDITVTNNDTVPFTLSGSAGSGPGHLWLDPESQDLLWQEFELGGNETKTIHLTGTIHDLTADHRVVFSFSFNGGTPVTIDAPVTQAYGVVDGHVYTDANHNGSYDPGEGLGQIKATLADYNTLNEVAATTTAPDGGYRFDQVATGTYYLQFSSPDGWIYRYGDSIIEVTRAGVHTEVLARRPLTDTLQASAAFDKPHYAEGATAKVIVKLHNSGVQTVSGVRGLAGGAGSDADLTDVNCGPLDSAEGVDVPAGRTVSVTCTGSITPTIAAFGIVSLELLLGPGGTGYDDGPFVSATASAGDNKGHADGRLVYDKNGDHRAGDDEGVPGVKVTVVDSHTGRVGAKTTTDAHGNFSVKGIPTGDYRVEVAGPWQSAFDRDMRLWVTTKGACDGVFCSGPWTFFIKPGPDSDGDAPPAGQGSPAPRVHDTDTLAYTGVDVRSPMTIGLLALVAGAALVLIGRRPGVTPR